MVAVAKKIEAANVCHPRSSTGRRENRLMPSFAKAR